MGASTAGLGKAEVEWDAASVAKGAKTARSTENDKGRITLVIDHYLWAANQPSLFMVLDAGLGGGVTLSREKSGIWRKSCGSGHREG